MPTNHVLRVPLEDSKEDKYVIICALVEREDNQNIDLEATEGELPYFSKFTTSKLAAARDTKSPLQPDEWMSTLFHTLLPTLHPAPLPHSPKTTSDSASRPSTASTASLSVTASISNSMLHIRLSHIYPGGLTQRLGSLAIPAAEDHEIDFMKWTSTAVLYAEYVAKQQLEAEQSRKAYEAAAQRLESQMQDIISAKDQGERKLLASCCELLNMKKAKVRGLMRAMETGYGVKVKNEVKQELPLASEEGAVTNRRPRKNVQRRGDNRPAETSRKAKRKQDTEGKCEHLSSEVSESDDSDSGFEDLGARITPDRSEDDITEDDGGHMSSPQPKPKTGILRRSKSRDQEGLRGPTRKSPATQSRVTASDFPHPLTSGASKPNQDEVKGDSPPPMRDLPFGVPKQGTKFKSTEDGVASDVVMKDIGADTSAQRATGEMIDEDQETSDDEL